MNRGVKHPCATTTPKVRRAIQSSDEPNTKLAARFGVDPKTVAKWRGREDAQDAPFGPSKPSPGSMTVEEQAIAIAFRARTRVSLEDCLVRLRRLMPHLSRSTLQRCFRRNGYGRIGRPKWVAPLADTLLKGPFSFEVEFCKIAVKVGPARFETCGIFLAIDEIMCLPYGRALEPTSRNAARFLEDLIAQFPNVIIRSVETDGPPLFSDFNAVPGEDMAPYGDHPFAQVCRAHGIAHPRAGLYDREIFEPKSKSGGTRATPGKQRTPIPIGRAESARERRGARNERQRVGNS